MNGFWALLNGDRNLVYWPPYGFVACSRAALLQEREAMRGKKVALVLSGGNLDRALYLKALTSG